MAPRIGSAVANEIPAVVALLQTLDLPTDGVESLSATTLVARENGRVVGCAALELYGDAALLRSVAVEPTLQGRGLGGQLTDAALELARKRAVRTVYLLTTTAGEFFPRFGFRSITRADVDPRVRRSVEFTTACPDSALVMRLELPA